MAPRKKKAETEGSTKAAAAEKKPAEKAGSVGTNSQPTVNIGMIGHVDHGKTTLVRALSGKWTDTHSEEIKRGITIRLGYADVTIYKYPGFDGPDAVGISQKNKDGVEGVPIRRISLVDAPGHESLMATMLCGASIMDGALLLIAANETCPQPQTVEHLTALTITGIDKLIVVQNKVDIVSEEDAKKNYNEIKAFLAGTKYADAPIIPLAALHNVNVDALLDAINTYVPEPKRDLTKPPRMLVARSFDINKPGTAPKGMVGGVIGGALKEGEFHVGDDIEILPGYEVEERNAKVWKPLRTTIKKIMTGGIDAEVAGPGGTFAILTTLEPSVVKSDKLVGSLIGHVGKLPPVWNTLTLDVTLLDRVVGAKDQLVVAPVKLAEMLMLNVNAAATVGVVKDISKGLVKVTLRRPVCAGIGAHVTIARNVGQRWRLIGYAAIKGP